jgi:outer membrane protein OmpA-like peptidoglycan-associated protein
MRSAGEIYVIGHTDSMGDDQYNQKLSEARAISVMRWLNETEDIPLALMKGRGMGSKKPITYNTMPDGSDNPEGRAKNRRVEIRFASQS